MNTHTIQWQAFKRAARAKPSVATWQASEPLVRATQFSSRLLLAATPALAVIVAAAWAVGAGITTGVLPAVIWATGFIFLALAIEARGPNFTALLLTGLALPVLALLSMHASAEFAVLAAVLTAGWIFRGILHRTA